MFSCSATFRRPIVKRQSHDPSSFGSAVAICWRTRCSLVAIAGSRCRHQTSPAASPQGASKRIPAPLSLLKVCLSAAEKEPNQQNLAMPSLACDLLQIIPDSAPTFAHSCKWKRELRLASRAKSSTGARRARRTSPLGFADGMRSRRSAGARRRTNPALCASCDRFPIRFD
jgi:hypothetical protein